MTLLGIDVSSHQGAPDYAAIRAAGYSFAVAKLTGGDQYVNPYFPQQMAGARAVGFPFGIYHYDGEPTIHTGTPDAEAAWLLAHLPSPFPDDVFLALDAEESATRDPTRYARWWQLVTAATRRRKMLYTYHDFITGIPAADWAPMADALLWYALYPSDVADIAARPMPTPPPPWDTAGATIWQYSGAANVPGVPTPCDLDRFDGSADDLRALALPVAAAAAPNPNPGFPGALQPDGRTVLNGVDFGGTAVCVEEVIANVRNAAGERYSRRWVGYQLDPWLRRT